MKTKTDAFIEEAEILSRAEEILSNGNGTDFRAAYEAIVSDYANLLNEARFLTKVSDRLEKKLSKANDLLEQHNVEITKEKNQALKENAVVKRKNEKITSSYKETKKKLNRFQLAVLVIVILAVLMLGEFIYILMGTGGPATP